jgi:hypothetical protein
MVLRVTKQRLLITFGENCITFYCQKGLTGKKCMTNENKLWFSDDEIVTRIYSIRGIRVMIDRDLAVLYHVDTRVLNQAVKRNLSRFPDDFMFQLDPQEFEKWKSQFVTSKSGRMGLRKRPWVFSEQGIAMLSSVLNSELAIQMNIRIIRIFTRVRNLIGTHQEILKRLMLLEQNDADQEKKIMLILDYLKSLEIREQQEKSMKDRNRIGFKIPEG